MSRKWYYLVTAAIFTLLSFAHLTRLATGWEIAIAGKTVPQWLSLPGIVVTGSLAAWGFSLARKQ